jgi:VanZ family protein
VRHVWLWGPVVLFMALLFMLSGRPGTDDLPGGISDKAAHFIAYAVLSALVLRALTDGFKSRPTLTRAGVAILIAALYGVSDEFHQGFIPSRHSEFADLIANGLGAMAGALIVIAAFLIGAHITDSTKRGSY